MHKRIIFAILIALAIAAPAASQYFTIVDCDGIQLEYIGTQTDLEPLCSVVREIAAVAEATNMELNKIVFYDLIDWYMTLHLVLDRTDFVDISMSPSVVSMTVGYSFFTCGLADTVDLTLIYDVDLRVDTGDNALLIDLAAGSITCPDGVEQTELYDNSWRSWDRLKEYTPE